MADITNAQGTLIFSHMYFCMEQGQLHSDKLWPKQPQLGPRHRAKWQKFLDQFCNILSLVLRQSLGQWIKSPPKRWEAYYDPSLCTVLIQRSNRWIHYSEIQKGR